MGWSLDYSAITPGPGGTVMLGEKGGAEAVARRARERRQREQELALKEGKSDTMSEQTLVTGTQSNDHNTEAIHKDETNTQGGAKTTHAPEIKEKKGFRARWREFKERQLP